MSGKRKKAEETVKNDLQIEFMSNEQVSFDDLRGVEILEYDTETVKVGCGKMRIRLFGRELLLKKISPNNVMISGKISSMEFEQ